MNNSEYFNSNENPEDVFIKTSTTYNELINNIIASDNQNELTKLKTVNDFNLFHLIR